MLVSVESFESKVENLYQVVFAHIYEHLSDQGVKVERVKIEEVVADNLKQIINDAYFYGAEIFPAPVTTDS